MEDHYQIAQATTFLSLPPEVRLQIYHIFFHNETPTTAACVCLPRTRQGLFLTDISLSLLLTCRVIYSETWFMPFAQPLHFNLGHPLLLQSMKGEPLTDGDIYSQALTREQRLELKHLIYPIQFHHPEAWDQEGEFYRRVALHITEQLRPPNDGGARLTVKLLEESWRIRNRVWSTHGLQNALWDGHTDGPCAANASLDPDDCRRWDAITVDCLEWEQWAVGAHWDVYISWTERPKRGSQILLIANKTWGIGLEGKYFMRLPQPQ